MNPVSVPTSRSRVLYLDYLRILAAVAVIMIHVSAQNWEAVDIRSFERQVFAAYNTAVSWPVNLFIMLSGTLFLDSSRPLDLKKLYTKNIFRLLTAFFFWSAIYVAVQLPAGLSLQDAAQQLFHGHFHMWYIPMAIIYYASVPVFRKVAEDRKTMEYFLGLTFVLLFLIPSLLSFLNYFQPPFTGLLRSALSYWRGVSNFGLTTIFVFYFVYGTYLHRYGLPARLRKMLPLLAIAGYLGRVFFNVYYVFKTGSGDIPFDYCVLDLPVGTAVFLFCKDILSKISVSPRAEKAVRTVSDCTFGMYMVHVLVMYKLQEWLQLTTLSFHPVLSVPVLTLLISLISFGISWILHQIPLLKHYAV